MLRCCAALCVLACAAASMGATRVGHLAVDYGGFLSRNDVVYLGPAREGWEGLPLGNGRLGAQVWQPGGLTFQLNTPLSGVYGGAIARIHLTSKPGMLAALRRYEQRLSLHDATVATTCEHIGGRQEITAFIAAGADVLVAEVADARPGVAHRVELETWRRTAATRAEGGVLLLTDTLKCGGEPDYRFALAVAVLGADATADGDHALAARGGRLRVCAAFAGTRDPKADVAAQAKATLASARDAQALRAAHLTWWHDFWAKSVLHLHSDDGLADYMENLWYVHLYAMAAGSRGEVPPKFNGGLWTHERDRREWGSSYWHWNEQEAHWPLFAANHLELHVPYQRMYFGMLPAVKQWTKQMYGLDGAQFQETIPFHGRMPRWATVRGVHPRVPVPAKFGHTNAILSSSAEIAMQFWWVWLYTGDEAFLRERVAPLVREVALFYLGYLEKDERGRYIVWPSNAHESFWRVKNPTTDLAAMRYLFPRVGAATGDAALARRCLDALRQLAPYPVDPRTDAFQPYELRPDEKPTFRNAEHPELFPIGVFPLITLNAARERKALYERALRTFRARRNLNTYGWNTDAICAARLGIADAADSTRLFPGWTPKDSRGWGVERLLPNHAERYQLYPCGLMDYYSRRPGLHYYLEGSGTFSTACGEMLLQSWDGVIRVAPALPRAWSARFTLLAMGGFLVTAECEGGNVAYVAVHSQRGGPCRLANPFGEPAVVLGAQGKVVPSGKGPILAFPTTAGHTCLVVPASRRDAARNRPVLSGTRNTAPKALPPAKRRWIGRPAPPTLGDKPAEANPPSPPPVPARGGPAPAAIEPARAAAPPKIDGFLDDAAWKGAKPVGHFLDAETNAPAAEPTELRLACDGKALYVAITAWESRMECQLAQPKRRGERPVDGDDSVALLVRPTATAGAWWRLAVNALGARCDALCSPGGKQTVAANPKWDVAARRWSNRWTVEAALPYAALAPEPPAAGAAWGLRVERQDVAHGVRSAFPAAGAFLSLRLTGVAAAAAPQAAEPGLVGYWDGTLAHGAWVRDRSGNGLHGLVVGRVQAAEGKSGKGLALRGGYVEVPASPRLDLTAGLTLMAWVWPERVGSMRLIDKAPAGRDGAFLFDTHPRNHLRFITRFGALGTEAALPVQRWSHVAATFDGEVRRIAIDGRIAAEAKRKGALDTTDLPLRFGADSHGRSQFIGRLDEIRIYDRALDASEIRRVARLDGR